MTEQTVQDKRREYQHAYRATHREELTAHQRAYDAEHREKKAAYRVAHRKEIDQYKRVYHAAHRKEGAAYRAAHREEIAEKKRVYNLAHYYGLTPEQCTALYVNQDGKCAICGKHQDRLNTDHDHATNKVRGLLCRQCNTAIGLFFDDPEILLSAVAYLKAHTQ